MNAKRLFLVFCLTCFSCIYCMAGSDLEFVQGNKKQLKQIEGEFLLEFVWNGATFDNKQPLTEKFKNLEDLKPIAWDGFVEEFNQRSKKSKVVKDGEKANYKISMKIDKMDQYFKVMGFIPGNATKVWGTLTITNLETKEVIAIIKVDEVDGGANPSPDGSFSDCFEELGKQLSKFK